MNYNSNIKIDTNQTKNLKIKFIIFYSSNFLIFFPLIFSIFYFLTVLSRYIKFITISNLKGCNIDFIIKIETLYNKASSIELNNRSTNLNFSTSILENIENFANILLHSKNKALKRVF